MTDFVPAPWPDSIRAYFAEGAIIAEVPAFLHELIADFTETLATSEPDFRYQNIQIKFGGTVLVWLEEEDVYDRGFQEILEAMMKELTDAYTRAARR